MSGGIARRAAMVLVVTAAACGGGDDDDEVGPATTAAAATTAPGTTEVPTTVAPPTTDAPSTSAAPTTVAATSASEPSGLDAPPTDAALAARIPTVDGHTIVDLPADDVYWRLLRLPDELVQHHALILGADGEPVGRLVVAAASGERPAIDTFVEHTFSDAVYLPNGPAVAVGDDSTMVVENTAIPLWSEIEGNAVIRAEQEIDGTIQWGWGADDLVWIVRGTAATEEYVRAVLREHAKALDPYDQQGMTGDLFEHLPDVPGYTYWDFPRETTVAEIGQSMLGDCIERYYVGYVRPKGADDRPYDFDDLGVGLLQPAGACMDTAVLEDLVADIAATEGVQQQEIGGHTVFRDEVSIVAVIGDVVVVLASEDLAMFDEMAGFIVPFLQNQPA